MNISAVICELNPLHDGHKYIFNKAKSNSDVVIAIMSGNYVQRGECSIYDKYQRAIAVVDSCADICLELPFPYSSSSAEYFASAGVSIAEKIGATDLYFGSESGDCESIKKAAELLNREEYKHFLKGGRVAEKREEYLRSFNISLPESLYGFPNDMLATEYARCTKLSLHAIKRIDTKSASDIRKELISANADLNNNNKLLELEFNHLRTTRELNKETMDSGTGLVEWMYKNAKSTNNKEDFLAKCSTKNYTNSRIRRALLYNLISVTKDDFSSMPMFSNVLAMNKTGREYLSDLSKKDISIKLISRKSDSNDLSLIGKRQYELNSFADQIYTICSGINDPSFFLKKHTFLK